jgi:hypothetical protein
MTATTVKGIEITNIEASPITPLDRKSYDNELKVSIAKLEVATTSIDETADVMLLCPIPSHAIVDGVYIKNDDLDSHACPTLAVDIGLYYSGKGTKQVLEGRASGDEINVDGFASAVTTLQAANVTWQEVTNEALNIDNYATEAWSGPGGLSADPGGFFYIGAKVTTVAATAAAGGFIMKVEYR